MSSFRCSFAQKGSLLDQLILLCAAAVANTAAMFQQLLCVCALLCVIKPNIYRSLVGNLSVLNDSGLSVSQTVPLMALFA